MPHSQGEILNNRYRIISLLGQGGFGAVYRAWDCNLDRSRAIKENLDTSEQAQRQFKREAQLLDQLVHPNLPRVIDHFIIPGIGQYLVMDYVEGQDLAAMLDDVPLPEAKVLPWIIQICDALSYLHTQNPPVIHRDIKPANIKITPEGKAMLVDFGISKIYDPNIATTLGARAITPGYSPPEQYGKGTTDARSDLYALGATLYHLLTGHVPPDSVDILTHNSQPPPPPIQLNPNISNDIASAVSKAMELDREARWKNADEFKNAITTRPTITLKEITVPATSVSPTQIVKQPASVVDKLQFPKSIPWKWIGVAILIIAVILIGYFLGGGRIGTDFNSTQTSKTLASVITFTDTPIPEPVTIMEPTNTSTESLTSTITVLPVSSEELITDEYGIQMVLVKAGPFEMGADVESSFTECQKFRSDCQRSWFDFEEPIHTVNLDSFYIDVYEITNELFARFLNEFGNQEENGDTWLGTESSHVRIHQIDGVWQVDSGFYDHPVIEVSWYGARSFCQWRGSDLPTEAQWEKAARGGMEDNVYPWGIEAPICTKGADNGVQFVDCEGTTVTVGSFSPNGYGLYDMAGNVWEWGLDWFDENYYSVSTFTNPLGPPSGNFRVLRGGSWDDQPDNLRIANRGWSNPVAEQRHGSGFRCARAIESDSYAPGETQTPISSTTVTSPNAADISHQQTEIAKLTDSKESSIATLDATLAAGHITQTPNLGRSAEPSPSVSSASQLSETSMVKGTQAPLIYSKGYPMRLVPKGIFTMGESNKNYVHEVYLDAYYIDMYEVTNSQYAKCEQEGLCIQLADLSSKTRDSYYGNPEFAKFPVINVDWQQARSYCVWRGGDLPTEAQWEKAARGGLEGQHYPWGYGRPKCWGEMLFGGHFNECSPYDTIQVGGYQPNGFGLYDMAGNVFEWVLDWYDIDYYEYSPYNNPTGPSSGSDRVFRGGAWSSDADDLNVYSRSHWSPDITSSFVGFRCVQSP